MATVTDEKIREVARKLWIELYEESFRGKSRGRYCISRDQMRDALETTRLHSSTVQKLCDEALSMGLVIIDLDDCFPCIEVKVLRKYRRPPAVVFERYFNKMDEASTAADEDDEL